VEVGPRRGRCAILSCFHPRFSSNELDDPAALLTASIWRALDLPSLTSLPTRETVLNRAMTISVDRSLTAKPTLPISPASSTAMSSSARDGGGASPDGSGQAELRQAVKTENGISSRDESQKKSGDDPNEGSSNSEEPTRKRRRSRKGLEKRFECSAEGCGKSYSRAEHL
jgi:hypothetical protein